MISLIDTEKALKKPQDFIHNNNTQQTRNRGELKLDKEQLQNNNNDNHHQPTTSNIMVVRN